MAATALDLSRRHLLAGAGSLLVSFSLAPRALADAVTNPGPPPPRPPSALPGSLRVDPHLDAWIRIDASGGVTIFSGKAELGQAMTTALRQIAAEELFLPFERVALVTADTGATVNEGYTAGSHTISDSGTAIRHAAAQIRELLKQQAAQRLGRDVAQLSCSDGHVDAAEGGRLAYAELVAGLDLHVAAQPTSRLKDPKEFRLIGTSVPRDDIPAKVTGAASYIQDMRLPGMLHARIVRPPSYRATLTAIETDAVAAMPGVAKVVRNGNFVAVLAAGEYQAVKAMRALAAACTWSESARLPAGKSPAEIVKSLASKEIVDLERQAGPAPADAVTVQADFSKPYQAHGSIGPSCAIAQFKDGVLTVWTHTQGVYPDRAALAQMLRMNIAQIRCIHVPGSGCYGHNGADDAAGDAAMLAIATPGVPVRVHWMREQEMAWEPYGPAMLSRASAKLSGGRIVDWQYDIWSQTHAMRPGGGGALLAAQHMQNPLSLPPPLMLPLPEGGGNRNGIPIYDLPNAKVVHHFQAEMPLRVSSLRSLGAYFNVFAIESFMDELALAAGLDPVAFRLAHLADPRARDVIRMAADTFGWAARDRSRRDTGYGFAFARYKNLAAYCAVAVELDVDRETGRTRVKRAVAAVDSGQIVNPDGVRNQIEGGLIQSASWTLFEEVSFDEQRVTSIDWSTYPILRFESVPDALDVHLIDRPGAPFLGAGEAAQGPTAAAIANALADATKTRFRDLPLTPPRVKASSGRVPA